MTLLIGVGNEFRQDDGLGFQAAKAVPERPGLLVRTHSGEGTGLMELWSSHPGASVILVDAMQSGAAPGTVLRWTADSTMEAQKSLRCSSHAFGVAEAIALARSLNKIPERLTVLAVEGESFSHGTELSPSVKEAIPKLIRLIEEEINHKCTK